LNTQSNVKNNNHNEEEVTSDYIDFIDFVDKYPLPMRSNSDRVAKSNENGDFYDKESLSSPMLIENAKSISQYNVENNNNNGNINNNDDNVSPGQLPPFNTTFTLHSAYSFIYDETNNEKIQKTTQYKEDIRELEDQLNGKHEQHLNNDSPNVGNDNNDNIKTKPKKIKKT